MGPGHRRQPPNLRRFQIARGVIRGASVAPAPVSRCHPRPPHRRLLLPQEPVKYEVLAYLRGEGPRPARRALAILETPPHNCVIEAVLDLETEQPTVVSWKQVRRGSCSGQRALAAAVS